MSLHWYSKAADIGNKDAMANFGVLVNKYNLESQYSKALRYLSRCIKHGSSFCLYSLSLFIPKFKEEELEKKVNFIKIF